MMSSSNPFASTKASHFSDKEITDYWVELPGFNETVEKLRSPIPKIVLGGKGSGKTHLMRFFSYSVRKLKHAAQQGTVAKDGYLGVYTRCGGLNSHRFDGKGYGRETWAAIFSYYTELWLGEVLLETARDMMKSEQANLSLEAESQLVSAILELFDRPATAPRTFDGLMSYFRALRKDVDHAVNNAALVEGALSQVEINVTNGHLIFGIPRVLQASLPGPFGGIRFLFLIDEFENLAEEQQKYVNTLIREQEPPCTFVVGSRLYGLRTLKTYSGEEENREGAEFEYLRLDEILREHATKYAEFSRRMITQRLTQAGLAEPHHADPKWIDTLFEKSASGAHRMPELSFAVTEKRPHVDKLRNYLGSAMKARAFGIRKQEDVELVLDRMRAPDYPLVEKLSIFLLYQDWQAGNNLLTSSESIAADRNLYLARKKSDRFPDAAKLFGSDLAAQLYRDFQEQQPYLGVETFIGMSDGMPRNLLIILKHIYGWAAFNGETPFSDGCFSRDAQQKGVREASNWFFQDGQMEGRAGEEVRVGISRLAEICRAFRFSDKPSESSIVAFSTDLPSCSALVRRNIWLAQGYSLLVRVPGGRKGKNSKRVDEVFQLNSMLAPRYDLGYARRGVLSLKPDEADVVLNPERETEFQRWRNARVARMTGPRFGRDDETSPALPGLLDD